MEQLPYYGKSGAFIGFIWVLNILHHVSKDGVSWALAIIVSIMTGINQIIIFRNNKKK